jgi:glycosyltransferase 2 family protein
MRGSVWRNVVLSVLVSGAFLWAAFRGVSLSDVVEQLRHTDPFWLAVAVGISFLIMVFRAWRWQLELRPLEHVPLGRLWTITAIAYMCINLLPVRLGEVVRPWLLSRRSNVKFSNVVGNLVVEKTMDSVVLLLYMIVGLLSVSNLPVWVRRGAVFPAVIAGAMVLLVALVWWRGEAFVGDRVLAFLPERFRNGLRKLLVAIRDGMKILPDPRLLSAVFLVSLALWFLPILSSWAMIQAFGFDVPFGAAVAVFIFIGFGTALPNAPGMIGVFQYACVLALGLFGIEQSRAAAYGVVLNAVQFLTLILQGVIALPLAGVSLRDLRNAAAPPRDETAAPDEPATAGRRETLSS